MSDLISIVTDSTSDIPPEVLKEHRITTVPVYIRFGHQVYRDGVDMTPDELYRRLTTSDEHASTSQPTPEDFAKAFTETARNSDSIISIQVSSKVSGTYNAAVLGSKALPREFPIEVVDSRLTSAGLGLVVLDAAKNIRLGKSMAEVVADAHRCISEIGMIGVFNTLKYLSRGGRINKAIAMAGNFLNVKPLITFHDGELALAGLARTFPQGINRVFNFIGARPISDLMIVHSTIPEQAEELKKKASQFIDVNRIIIGRLGAALGVHGGPGVLLLAVRRKQ
jgi:DegV family protein with EDD domain